MYSKHYLFFRTRVYYITIKQQVMYVQLSSFFNNELNKYEGLQPRI